MGKLPSKSNWKFDKFVGSDADRILNLEAPLPPDEILNKISDSFLSTLRNEKLLFGLEVREGFPNQTRIVFQFESNSGLFDTFFNGRTGYRAHFRAGICKGIR